jgi:flagellar P-ring protein precursor FlgI
MIMNLEGRTNIAKLASTAILMLLMVSAVQAQPVLSRVKDVANLDGMQNNIIYGYGLVAGLEGTGDGRQGFTRQSLANMLGMMNVKVRPDEVIPDNVAAVWVEATIPPFVRPGQTIDARITSLGQAQSLQGGSLLPTPLLGADGKIHGLSQGPISIGGFRVDGGGGGGGAVIQQNHTLVGIIPNGVIVEGEMIDHDILQDGNSLRWLLDTQDFKTASNLERKINSAANLNIARAEDAGAIRVFVGVSQEGNFLLGNQAFPSLVSLIAYVDDLEIETDEPAKIVINERTGTVVAGQNIRVRNVVIAQGALRISINSTEEAQGGGFNQPAVPVINTTAQAEENAPQIANVQGTTVGELVEQLNQLGYSPRDLISIFESMAAAGAIKAQIVKQ